MQAEAFEPTFWQRSVEVTTWASLAFFRDQLFGCYDISHCGANLLPKYMPFVAYDTAVYRTNDSISRAIKVDQHKPIGRRFAREHTKQAEMVRDQAHRNECREGDGERFCDL